MKELKGSFPCGSTRGPVHMDKFGKWHNKECPQMPMGYSRKDSVFAGLLCFISLFELHSHLIFLNLFLRKYLILIKQQYKIHMRIMKHTDKVNSHETSTLHKS